MIPPIDQDSTLLQTDHRPTRRSLLKNAVQQGLILYAAPKILYSGSVQAQGFISGIPNGFEGNGGNGIPALVPTATVAAGAVAGAGNVPPVAAIVPVAAAGAAGGSGVAAPVIPAHWTSPAATSGPGVDPFPVLGAPLASPVILAQAGPASSGGGAGLPPAPVKCSKRRSKKDKLPPGCKVKKIVRGLG